MLLHVTVLRAMFHVNVGGSTVHERFAEALLPHAQKMDVEASRSACLSVCSHISNTTYPNFTKFSTCTLPVTVVWFSSDDSAVRYVVTVLWMTSCFHVTGQIQIQAVHKLFTVSCPGGAAKLLTGGGGKSAMANCLVFTRHVPS